ncbi:hypothetical protein [Legionella maioricensis]|uniref:Leucine-rich repeat-containing protein n=1 Tax=Legionella maioricensis TaxID=2896528 RepID=A0A9X2D387_9GAMM|nr:hypothetical protein [Legionella maioricensis]MCL9685691.1 hypothetical protein [Legionella maioricensis]MCL9689087.1 hypothetical protein [Legionella maioricensis]
MPLSRLPIDLQARFVKKGFETVLDLSNYPLDKLTSDEFTALVAVLGRNQFLTHLYLDNCGLAKLKPHHLNALLTGLNHLVGCEKIKP